MREELMMSYIAGIIDGDGSFSIIKICGKSKNPLYSGCIQLSKKLHELPHLLKEQFGGYLYLKDPHVDKKGELGPQQCHWMIRNREALINILDKITPFLRVKKDQALLLKEFADKFKFVRGHILTEEKLRDRERDHLKMIRLNEKPRTTLNVEKKPNEVSNNEIDWAYIAGLIDTEGSFSIKKQVSNKGTHVINPRYLPVIQISMTSLNGLNVIRKNFPYGEIYIPKNTATSRGYHYQYGIHSKEKCIEFILKILPYLKGKRVNALCLLEFCRNVKFTRHARKGIPPEELQYRESMHQQLKNLNKYGVFKPSLIDLEAQKQGDRAEVQLRIIKMTNFMKTFLSKSQNFRGYPWFFLLRERLSKFNHCFNMSFFNYKIWKKDRKQNIHKLSSGIPSVLDSPVSVFVTSISSSNDTAKGVFYPVHEFFVSINNLNSWPVVKKRLSVYFLNIYSSFSIDYTRKIGKLFVSPHNTSFVSDIIAQIGLIVYRERLNEMASQEDAKV